MSGVIHPVGPKNPRVYWVRRALLAGAIFSTLVLIFSLLNGKDESPVVNASPLPAPSQSEIPTVLPGQTQSASPSSSVTKSPAVTTDCTDEQISVVVAMYPANPKVGQDIKISMTITNTGTVDCFRDVGNGANEITIISGPALIWSTDHCNPSTASDVRKLSPNQKLTISATFNGTQTSKGCVKHNQSTAGTYWAHARNISKNSDGLRFVISD
ncbi:MAG: hypothetical protein RIR66_62 [Actinomycetota bacterium]